MSKQPGVKGWVAAITRFPVKSTAGEALSTAEIDDRGLVFDRGWAVYTADGGIASGKTTRRFRKVPGLMGWRSAVDRTATGYIWDPDDRRYQVGTSLADQALSQAFGQSLAVRPESVIKHHDESGVHVVTTSSVRRVEQLSGAEFDPRRVRANIVVATEGVGFVEDGWSGAIMSIGSTVVLHLGVAMPRCVMIDQPQAGVSPAVSVLKQLGREHGTALGLKAAVVRTGTISLGDVVCVREI